jgi:adenosylmethionine-8-amino-7-oxononanoate transaminase
MDSSTRWRRSDRRFLWHPFTQQAEWEREAFPVIVAGRGATLIDADGRRYLDGVSSLWCNVHGHRHPAIDRAVARQLGRLAHATMLGGTHPAAIELARRLVGIAPRGLTRVFYSEDGAEAVEVALKMAFQYWAQNGGVRDRFVKLAGAYHGDTIGAVSVGGIDLFHRTFGPLLFRSFTVSTIEGMEQVLRRHARRVAAVILEPMVQGAAGMRLQPPGFVRAVRRLCTRHGVLMIADEVATGFGRTGRMFACEHEGVTPDLMALGKGITGGYLPLAATLTTERIYRGFRGAPTRTFFHGHTYTGNPLACAAALANLDVFRRERTLQRLGPKIRMLREGLAGLPVRQCGMMVGIDTADRASARRVVALARRRGLILRNLDRVVVLMPPLSIRRDELARLLRITLESLSTAAGRRL